MNRPITKEDLAWLAIRCTGIACVWFAFSKLAGFLFAAYLLTNRGLRELQDTLSNALSWNMAWPQGFWFLVYSALAYYMLVRGERVHRIICHSPKAQGLAAHKEERPENKSCEATGDSVSS
jgi:hypothetical protein